MKNFMRMIVMVIAGTFLSSLVVAEGPSPGLSQLEKDTIVYTEDDFRVVQISRMVKHLMRLAPAKKISRDADYRVEVVGEIIQVSDSVRVPLHLLVLVFYLESSFRTQAKGSKGELGIGQVMNPKKYGCDYSIRIGQMRCSAEYLRREYEKCGTWYGALSSYGSSNGTCQPKKGGKLESVVRFRMRKWARLRKAFPLPLDNTF